MSMTGTLDVATPGNREVVITGACNAPRRLVFDRYTKPDLVRRGLLAALPATGGAHGGG
jgi:hypothetical protein